MTNSSTLMGLPSIVLIIRKAGARESGQTRQLAFAARGPWSSPADVDLSPGQALPAAIGRHGRRQSAREVSRPRGPAQSARGGARWADLSGQSGLRGDRRDARGAKPRRASVRARGRGHRNASRHGTEDRRPSRRARHLRRHHRHGRPRSWPGLALRRGRQGGARQGPAARRPELPRRHRSGGAAQRLVRGAHAGRRRPRADLAIRRHGRRGWSRWAARRRSIGFSAIISIGDQIDVDIGDLVDYFALDHRTRAILLYVEELRDARKFMSATHAQPRASSPWW